MKDVKELTMIYSYSYLYCGGYLWSMNNWHAYLNGTSVKYWKMLMFMSKAFICFKYNSFLSTKKLIKFLINYQSFFCETMLNFKTLNIWLILFVLFGTDIDECASNNGGCDQVCKNDHAVFRCECYQGFSLDENGNSCNGM